jgi:hypothetical protein
VPLCSWCAKRKFHVFCLGMRDTSCPRSLLVGLQEIGWVGVGVHWSPP